MAKIPRPKPACCPNCPSADAIPSLLAALAAGRNVVLSAPPGAGKTTLVPLALLDAPWRGDGRILMLEPRRLATRAAAARMAALLGETVGGTVGFRTRLDAAVSPATRIEVVTEGLLVRRLQSDPGLDGVAAVILDEVHERSLESDLALALCLDLQRVLRPELRLLAMSATAEAARLAGLMDAEVIESAGRMFPVAISHAARDIPGPRDLPDAMARAVRAALAEHDGDILALPARHGGDPPHPGGARGLRRAGAAAARRPAAGRAGSRAAAGRGAAGGAGDLDRRDLADRARRAHRGRWRLAAGAAARSGHRPDPAGDAADLARRRRAAGRPGRARGAGRRDPAVVRGAASRPARRTTGRRSWRPNCRRWRWIAPPGERRPADLAFLDPPPAGRAGRGAALLAELGALDAQGRITDAGRRMAALGAHPRLAAMMLAAGTPGEAALAADLAALLEERDPLRGPDAPADIGLRLAAIADGDPAADRGALSRIRRVAGQYRRRLRLRADAPADGDPGRLLAAAFPDRIAQRRGEPGSFRLAGGGGARLPRADPLANAPLLAVAALEMKAAARIRLAAPLDPDALAGRSRITEQVETGFDPVSGAVLARRRRRLGALVLGDRTEPADPAEIAAALARAVAADGLRALPWTDAARQFQARVALMRRLEPDAAGPTCPTRRWRPRRRSGWRRSLPACRGSPNWRGSTCSPSCVACCRGTSRRRLDAALPAQLALPGGRAAIDYTQPVPVASARAQAFYGLAATPQLADGRVPLQLALLSPAGRPVAITADLAGFWRGGWADVRRDMRGRYPEARLAGRPGARRRRDRSPRRAILVAGAAACHLLPRMTHSYRRESTAMTFSLAAYDGGASVLASWRSRSASAPARRPRPAAPSPARRRTASRRWSSACCRRW